VPRARPLRPNHWVTRAAGALFALVVSLVMVASAGAAWHEPAGAVSTIGRDPDVADIGGVPYVAWDEVHGSNAQLFVGRMNAAGTGWEKVGGPVNFDLAKNARSPSLASVEGVPYVAWVETDGTSQEVRVARLNSAGTGWEEAWRGVDATHGGVNRDSTKDGHLPRLTAVGGVPYVAWDEQDGTNSEVRVAKLDTSTQPLPTWTEPAATASATLGGVNESTTRSAFVGDLASIDNTPYVAWRENNGTNEQVRVARLNTAGTGWEQGWTGKSASSGGINAADHNADLLDESRPSLASVNGFPYVAWSDSDGTNLDARVARLDTSTPGSPTWTQEATGVSATDGRINQSPTNSALSVRVAAVGAAPFGVQTPYVAWVEYSGTSPNDAYQVRVARFQAATHAWVQAWPGVSPTSGGINDTPATKQRFPAFAAVGNVPYVASNVYPGDGVEVSRLEPEFTAQSASATTNGATLTTTAHTYGIPYPIGFQYGTALGQATTPVAASPGADSATVTAQVGGLAPKTTYQYRPFATAGAPQPLVLGTTASFTTTAAGGTGNPPPPASPAISRERLAPSVFPAAPSGPSVRAAAHRHTGTKVTFKLNVAARVSFRITRRVTGRKVKRGGKTVCVKPARANRHRPRCTRTVTLAGSFARAAGIGSNSLHFSGRLRGRKLKPGRYRLVATPSAGGRRGRPAAAGFRIVR
jgi:hypothetical protein